MTPRTLRFIFSIFLTTRLALFAIALFAVLRMPINATEAQGFHLPPQPHAFLEAWARYDACWYVVIAEHGYRGPIGPYGDMRANFFPLFPALVTAVIPLARTPLLAGLIVANACYFAFLVLLWTIVRLDWSVDVARRAVWIYLLFPSTFFLSGAYSESVLLAAAAGALLSARRRHWLAAGLLAGLATLTRPVGIVAIVPLVTEYISMRRERVAYTHAHAESRLLASWRLILWKPPMERRAEGISRADATDERQHRPQGSEGSSRVAVGDGSLVARMHVTFGDTALDLLRILAPTVLAVAGYLVFAGAEFGDPLATLTFQASIRGPLAVPWQPFVDLWNAGPRLHAYDNSIVDAALALMAVAALPAIYTRVRPSYACYALLIVLIPLSGSLMSFNRLLLPSFPHAILLARFVKRPWALAALLVPFAILEAVLMTAFATWNWVA